MKDVEVKGKKVMIPLKLKRFLDNRQKKGTADEKNAEDIALVGVDLGKADYYEWESPEALEAVYKWYFKNVIWKFWTITDIKIIAGGKRNFEKYRETEGYRNVIDWAMLMVEKSYENSIRKLGRTSDIFVIKQFGSWKDKNEIDLNVKKMIVMDNDDLEIVK